MKNVLVKISRRAAWLALVSIVVVANVIAAAFFYIRTDSARERLLSIGLHQLEAVLPGGMTVGSSEGDLTRGLVLHDVVMYDLEHVMAVRADRLELRYSLLSLLAMRVQVDYLGADGLVIVSRPLADGRDNLGTIAVKHVTGKPAAQGPRAPLASPVAVLLEELDADARFVRLPHGVALEHAPHDSDVRGRVRGRATLSHAMGLDVADLRIDLTAPTHAQLRASGAMAFSEKVTFKKVTLHVDGDLRGFAQHMRAMSVGAVRVDAYADGVIDDLKSALDVSVTSPALTARARTHLHADRIEVQDLSVRASFADVQASGTYAFDKTGDVSLKASIANLGAFAAFGAPPMSGRVELAGHAKRDETDTRIELKGGVDELVAPGVYAKKLHVDIDTIDLTGHALVEGTGLRAGTLVLRSVKLDAQGTPKQVRLTANAAGPEGVELAVGLTGVPRFDDKKLTGVEATLQELRFRAGGTPWSAEHPAHVSADFGMNMFAVSRLRMVNDPQQVTLEGRLMGDTIEGVFVELKHFDLSQLPGIVSPGHVLPHTDLSAEVEAHGPFDDPEIGGTFTGEAYGKGDSDLIHASGNGDARLAHGRLGGKVFVTIGGQKASSKFDMPMPLRPNEPIDVSFDASVLLSPTFADFLVPKLIQSQPLVMYALGAKVTAQGQLTGTTSDPKLHASGRIARWAAGSAHGDLGVSLEYGKKRLGASMTLELSSLPAGGGTGGGVVELTTDLPIDLTTVLTGGSGQLMKGDEPWHGELKVHHVGLDHLPFEAFGVIPIVQHGWVDGAAELAGNRTDPRITASLDAVGLTVGPVSDVDVHGSARMKGGAATADSRLSIHGSEAFRVHGSLDAGPTAHSLESGWKKAPLAIALDISDFDLGRLGLIKGLAGSLRGRAELTGSIAQPHAKAEFGAAQLRLGMNGYRNFRLTGLVAGTVASGKLVIEQDNGARLVVDAKVPWNGDAISGSLLATTFALDFGSETLPNIRLLRGVFDSDLKLSGTRLQPKILGDLLWSKGEVHLSTTAFTYRDIDGKLSFNGEKITVPSLRLRSGTSGELEGSGSITLDRLRPSAIEAQVAARHFPIQQAGVGMLLDAELAIAGQRNAQGVLTGGIKIKHGSASIPEIQRGRTLLPTASLEDVSVVSPPVAAGGPADGKDKAKPAAPHGPNLGAVLDGPFVIKGEEIGVTTRGNLTIDMSGQKPDVRGTLTADPKGWVQMFGRDYDLERGQIRFTGTSEPTLDFRITRRTPSTRIGVDVIGPAHKPELFFWSDPPVYDQAQVAGLMLTGNPSMNGVSTLGLQGASYGMVSNLIIASIHKNFLSQLPIDVFRLDGNQVRAANLGTGGSQIELGKYLTESLYVGYAYQIGAEGVGVRRANHNEARVEYHFSPTWQLEAKGGDAGVGNLDLYWTFRP